MSRYYQKIEIDYFDEIVSDTLKYLKEQKQSPSPFIFILFTIYFV